MPTLKTNLTEMKAAQVDRISLVSKAASRIPFRVIKEDRTMSNPLKTLDLAQVFKGKPAPVVPAIVGVVTMKGEALDAVKKAAADAGLKVDAIVENADGSVVLKQADTADGEALVVIKMGDQVAVTMKGFAPYNCNIDVTGENDAAVSFAEMCTAQGFYPDVSTVMDVLQQGVMQAAYKADDPKTAAESVAKMFDEAKAYAVSLMSALPAACFKMEKALKAAPNANGSMAGVPGVPSGSGDNSDGNHNGSMAGVPGTPGGEKKVTGMADGNMQMDPVAGGAPKGQNAASGMGDGAQVAKGMGGKKMKPAEGSAAEEATETPAQEAAEEAAAGGDDGDADNAAGTAADKLKNKAKKGDAEDAGAALSKMLSDGLAALSNTLTTQLTEAVGQVQKSVEGVQTTVQDLTQKMEKVEGVAKAAHEAATGTVLGSDAGADAHQTTQKSEHGGNYRGREIDTGFAPRRRPAAR